LLIKAFKPLPTFNYLMTDRHSPITALREFNFGQINQQKPASERVVCAEKKF
jgi:hypothetical protein